MEINFLRDKCARLRQAEIEQQVIASLCLAVIFLACCLRLTLEWQQSRSLAAGKWSRAVVQQRASLSIEIDALEAKGRKLDEAFKEVQELGALGMPASQTLRDLAALVSAQTVLSSLVLAPDAFFLRGTAVGPRDVPRLVQMLESIFPRACITLAGDAAAGALAGAESFEVRVEGWRDEPGKCRVGGAGHGR